MEPYSKMTLTSSGRQEMDFPIYHDISDLPFDKYPSYLKEGMAGVCTGGSAVVDVFSNQLTVKKNDLLVIFPHQLVSITDVSDDFSIFFFKISYDLFFEILSGMCRMTVDFFFYMRSHFCYQLSPSEVERFRSFCGLLQMRSDASFQFFRRESLIYVLRIFYFDIYVSYKNDHSAKTSVKYSHKEEIAFNFFRLVMEHYTENRDVAFYADKMCISPKYLTMVVKEVTGKSAKEWIVEYLLLELKGLLRDSMLDIKEVVARTRFPNQSLMSRFFRKHTGMSPTQYRESLHK